MQLKYVVHPESAMYIPSLFPNSSSSMTSVLCNLQVSHDDLLLLTRTGQRIVHTVALDFEQHQHDFSPRKDALARANAAGRGSTHLGAFSRSSTSGSGPSSHSSPVAKTRNSQTSSHSAGATAFSPPESTVKTSGELSSYLQDSYFGDGGHSEHNKYGGPNTASKGAPLSPRLQVSNSAALRGSTGGATNGMRTSVGGGQRGGVGAKSVETFAAPVENSRSWTISCENGLQIEVISDEPRAPLRFMRRRRHRRPKMNPGFTDTSTSSGSDFTVAAANAPLFKFQVAACYVIAHSTPGAYIVRVDDLAFTVITFNRLVSGALLGHMMHLSSTHKESYIDSILHSMPTSQSLYFVS